VSVILPVHNEAGHAAQEIERIKAALDASDFSYEIIVVDDGSTDGSAEIVATFSEVRLIRFGTSRGSGFARRVGSKAALGSVIVWTDVDMTYPNHEIPKLVTEMAGYDHIVGARTSEEGTMKVLRVPAKWFIRRLASYLTGTRIPDLNSGLRAFRRDVAVQFYHLLPSGFSCVTTLTMAFLSNGYAIKYIPIDYSPRAGESKFHWWRDTRKYLLQVVRMVLLYDPLRAFMPLALGILAVGLGKLVFDVVGKDFRVATNTLLIFFAGFTVALVALISDLIVSVNRQRDLVDPAELLPGKGDPGPVKAPL
jgi:glycosyltransferase involved in cell wall biosynthesis